MHLMMKIKEAMIGEFTGNYLVYENVDPEKHMNAWMKLLIRYRSNNDPWTATYTNTISVHPENQRFLIEMDQHTIETLDGSTHSCFCPYMLEEIIELRV
uniref:Uncharacterized protein n=1 Tax=Tanacetum cinerariifolium TaxID=118510 RepID=A0A6L2LLB4_TANCI|nr:hypothetical protein [Tanacetum cinerariifolium]